MIFDVLTLFPGMFSGPFDLSIVKRAQEKKLIKINYHDLREFAIDKRGSVDDRPYGGGVGMIMRVDVVAKALEPFKNAHKISQGGGGHSRKPDLCSISRPPP